MKADEQRLRRVRGQRRLCMIVHAAYPLAELRVEREAQAARECGFATTVIALRRPGELAEEDVDGVHVVRLPFERKRAFGLPGLMREYLGFTLAASWQVVRRRYWGRGAVVHVHNPPDFLILAALLPRLFGAAVIFDVHDLAPDLFSERFASRTGGALLTRLLLLAERLAAAIAHAVLTVHQPLAEVLTARGLPAGKMTIIMNSLDERQMPLEANALEAAEASAIERVPRVVYHGTITRRYGADLLVDAAARLSETHRCRVEIYGEGDALEELEEQRLCLGLTNDVVLSGRYLPQRDVLRAVAGADVGVYCSRPEMAALLPLPTKVLEYVALNVPVVCADLPTIRAHFNDDEILYFPAGNAEAFYAALADVLDRPKAARARAEAARRRYETQYSWSVYRQRYIDVLDELLRRGSAHSSAPGVST